MVDLALLETVFLLAMSAWLIVLGGAFLLADRRTDRASSALLMLAGVYGILWQQPTLLGFGEAFHVAVAGPVFISLLSGAIFLWTYWLFEQHVERLEATTSHLEDALAIEQTLVDVLNHDLRNPMAEARLKLQALVRDRPGLEEELAGVRAKLQQATDVMENGVAYSRVTHGPLTSAATELDLTEMVRDAVDACKERARTHDVHVEADLPGPLVIAASPLLERAVENLLDNAIKFSPEGGIVHVEVERGPSVVRIRVGDQGPGIPLEEREALVRRFSRSSPEGGGLGLGLAIARRLADLHGGELRIGESPAGGALVELVLPIPGRDPAGVDQATSPVDATEKEGQPWP